MFAGCGRWMYRHRRLVIVVWLIALAVSLPALPRVSDALKVGGFSSSKTESSHALDLLERQLGTSPSTLAVIFSSKDLKATDAAFMDQVKRALSNIHGLPRVTSVILPTQDPSLISPDGHTAYAVVGLDLPPEQAQRDVPAFERALIKPADLQMVVAGGPAFYHDIETVSQRDLRRAEVIAFPVALVALLLVFGSVVAAMVPLIVGGFGVAVILLVIYAVGQTTDLSIFVLNLATMLGLGLAVDYSLFITSRFREELARSEGDVGRSVERTVATAGRAVFFSGLTVLIGLSGLVLFSFMFLQSVGIAGVIVVFFSILAALTLLPALLGVIGTRIDWLRVRRELPSADTTEHGFWAALSHRVMAHPVLVLMPTLAILLVFGAPFLHVNISSPDATILPKDVSSRHGYDILVSQFGEGEISPLVIAFESPTSIFSEQNLGAIYDMGQKLARDPRVARIQSVTSANPKISKQQAILLVTVAQRLGGIGLTTPMGSVANQHTAMMLVYTRYPANDAQNKDLLAEIRQMHPGGDLTMLVGGGTAEIVDVVHLMYGDFPRAVALVVIATYIVLFLLLRSLVLPLKAILMNTLSILASYGALVFIFQEGHLSGLLNFTPLHFVEASLPVIMFCVLFGLSMDYEVFLLTRIREEWERTGDNTHSVAVGLQRSGRIITSAAMIVVVVTISFATADVVIVKALGVGIALAVFLDATIVRALLVPATMRLLGHINWWVPDRLQRWLPHRSFIEEST